jgi:nucleoside-diphosphate-sugar epimerase
MPRLFCFGLSYTARALVRYLEHSGPGAWTYAATVRSPEDQTGSEMTGVTIDFFSFGDSESRDALADATHILTSVPPAPDAASEGEVDPVLAAYSDALASTAPSWVGYLSTTGPYGDHGGAWIDESAAARPSGPRGRRRLDAEEAWRNLCKAHDLPLHIFRLPGLYGPGRSALDRMREGAARRIVKPGQVFSRIHIDDLAMMLAASMEKPRHGATGDALYNVADDLPAPPQDVVTFAAEILGMKPPPEIAFEEADLSPMARSFYSDSKRISNALIKSELGITLKYPTYREGLRAILDMERS